MASKPKTKSVIGRPTSFTQKMADAICEKLADGKSLRSICLEESMPAKATVFRWLAAHPSFRDQYAHARESQADTLADEIQDIADEKCKDMVAVQRNKMRIDSRKWLASKMRPKIYGDRVEPEGGGGDVAKTLAEIIERMPG